MAFERLLTDPEEKDFSAALDEAAQAANAGARARKLPVDRRTWAAALLEDAARPEGFRIWRSPDREFPLRVVALAWWTDRLGGRHYRVFGYRIGRYEPVPLIFLTDPASLLPLRLVHPDRVFPVVRAGKSRAEAFVVCSCGVAGTPEAIFWMGDCCGPCSDRRQEGGREAPINHADSVDQPGHLVRAGFGPDGRTLLMREYHRAHAWDLATGRRRSVDVPPDGSSGYATDWDRRRLIARLPEGLFVWDFQTGEQETHLDAELRALDNLAVGGPPGQMLLAGSRWYAHDGNEAGLFVWSAEDLGSRRLLYHQGEGGCPLTFSRDGRLLAVGRVGAIDLLDAETGALRSRLPVAGERLPVRLAVSADGGRLAASFITPDSEAELLLWHLATPGSPRPISAGEVSGGVGFSPDGRFLLVGREGGRIGVLEADGGRELLALAWHLGIVVHLDFSPDGETLVTTGLDRFVKLWPWRHLIGALA